MTTKKPATSHAVINATLPWSEPLFQEGDGVVLRSSGDVGIIVGMYWYPVLQCWDCIICMVGFVRNGPKQARFVPIGPEFFYHSRYLESSLARYPSRALKCKKATP